MRMRLRFCETKSLVPHVLLQVGCQGVVHVRVRVVPRGPVRQQHVHVLQLLVERSVCLPDLLQGVVLLRLLKLPMTMELEKTNSIRMRTAKDGYDDD